MNIFIRFIKKLQFIELIMSFRKYINLSVKFFLAELSKFVLIDRFETTTTQQAPLQALHVTLHYFSVLFWAFYILLLLKK
jgi:hypothetical protein